MRPRKSSVFSAPSSMASWAPALRLLKRKCGLIWACRYLSCASLRCAAIESSCCFIRASVSRAVRWRMIYRRMLSSILLKAFVTIPTSSSDMASPTETSRSPSATRFAALARDVRGRIIAWTRSEATPLIRPKTIRIRIRLKISIWLKAFSISR